MCSTRYYNRLVDLIVGSSELAFSKQKNTKQEMEKGMCYYYIVFAK
jgi:hypothetical protein